MLIILLVYKEHRKKFDKSSNYEGGRFKSTTGEAWNEKRLGTIAGMYSGCIKILFIDSDFVRFVRVARSVEFFFSFAEYSPSFRVSRVSAYPAAGAALLR